MKRDSRTELFTLIHRERQTTRTRLANQSGLSKAAVSGIVADLLDLDVVREVGKHQHGRGRSQVLLEINPTASLVLGAQLGDTTCTLVLTDLYARVLQQVVVPVLGTTPQDFVDAVGHGVRDLAMRAMGTVLGIGIGVPGSLDASRQNVRLAVPFGWKDVPLIAMLERHLRLPVQAANRAKVAALGEHWSRMEQGIDDLAYVHAGRGIVAGLVVGGKLYFGHSGLAGELGHTTVRPDGPICDCGNRGCLHMLASGGAIVREFRARLRLTDQGQLVRSMSATSDQAALEMILDAARQGETVAQEVLVAAAHNLGIAIANLVTLFNPQLVVVGGALGRFGDLVLDPIRREVRRRALPDALVDLEIVPPTYPGEEAGAIGAAAFFLEGLDPAAMLDGPLSARRAPARHDELVTTVSGAAATL